MTINIAIDIGRSESRGWNGRQLKQLPNRIATGKLSVMFGEKPEDTYEVTYGDKSYILGDGVRLSNTERSVTGSNKTEIESVVLCLTMIYLIAGDNLTIDVNLALGIPVNRFEKDQKVLAEKLKGSHSFTINGVTYQINIKRTFVMPEPFGTYKLMESRMPNLENELVGIIDIGQQTSDLMFIDNGDVSDDYSDGSEIAMLTVLGSAARAIQKQFGNEITIQDLEKCITSGNYQIKIGTGQINAQPFINDAAVRSADSLISKIKGLWGEKIGRIDTIILTGGGGAFFETTFKDAFNERNRNIVVPDEPRLANIKGFFAYMEKALNV